METPQHKLPGTTIFPDLANEQQILALRFFVAADRLDQLLRAQFMYLSETEAI
jgi:hypothetical protein